MYRQLGSHSGSGNENQPVNKVKLSPLRFWRIREHTNAVKCKFIGKTPWSVRRYKQWRIAFTRLQFFILFNLIWTATSSLKFPSLSATRVFRQNLKLLVIYCPFALCVFFIFVHFIAVLVLSTTWNDPTILQLCARHDLPLTKNFQFFKHNDFE